MGFLKGNTEVGPNILSQISCELDYDGGSGVGRATDASYLYSEVQNFVFSINRPAVRDLDVIRYGFCSESRCASFSFLMFFLHDLLFHK